MEQNLHTPEVYDFRRYDHLWQRVAPGLEPYPAPGQDASARGNPQTPAFDETEAAVPVAAQTNSTSALTPAQQDSQLPGAAPDPCCMGSAAAEMLSVLEGFIEEELGDQRHLQAMVRQSPSWARQRLRDMAAEEGERARRLVAIYYLITGECYRPSISSERITVGRWCAALPGALSCRSLQRPELRATGEGTTEPCLASLLEELSDGEYRQANALLAMLERSLRR